MLFFCRHFSHQTLIQNQSGGYPLWCAVLQLTSVPLYILTINAWFSGSATGSSFQWFMYIYNAYLLHSLYWREEDQHSSIETLLSHAVWSPTKSTTTTATCLSVIMSLYCYHQARTLWFYSSEFLQNQLIMTLVLFYVLVEYITVVNQMLLMISGDIEPNPGPGEFLYCTNSP